MNKHIVLEQRARVGQVKILGWPSVSVLRAEGSCILPVISYMRRDPSRLKRRGVGVGGCPRGLRWLMALKKALAREILDGTDARRRDIVRIVMICEQWHQNPGTGNTK